MGTLYRRMMKEVNLMDKTRTYTINIPKLYFDALDKDIREQLHIKGILPSVVIRTNNVATTELYALWAKAEEIKRETERQVQFINRQVAQTTTTRAQMQAMQGQAFLSPMTTYNLQEEDVHEVTNWKEKRSVRFALLSIAEKAMREASGTNRPFIFSNSVSRKATQKFSRNMQSS